MNPQSSKFWWERDIGAKVFSARLDCRVFSALKLNTIEEV
jgi:uncharacterized PurR-regulated membrane protein YhhQ (DUF165 family)